MLLKRYVERLFARLIEKIRRMPKKFRIIFGEKEKIIP